MPVQTPPVSRGEWRWQRECRASKKLYLGVTRNGEIVEKRVGKNRWMHILQNGRTCRTLSSHKNRPAGVIPVPLGESIGNCSWSSDIFYVSIVRAFFFPLLPFLSFPFFSFLCRPFLRCRCRFREWLRLITRCALSFSVGLSDRCSSAPVKKFIRWKKRVFFSLLYILLPHSSLSLKNEVWFQPVVSASFVDKDVDELLLVKRNNKAEK